jgi:hypothetical protein
MFSMALDFIGKGGPLSANGLARVCDQVGTKPSELWSVLHVETSGCGFLADRRPQILFERDKFSDTTSGRFDAAYPDVSNQKSGGYGHGGARQYDRLAQAIALDRTAALRSTSWGIAQLMGFHAEELGYLNVENMVTEMLESEDNQLVAMARFLKHCGLDKKLRAHDWAGFAHGYNGANYAQNNYDEKLAAAFASYSLLLPDLTVRTAQLLLTYKGYDPGTVDGQMGSRTRSALEEFQQKSGLPLSREADAATLESLRS